MGLSILHIGRKGSLPAHNREQTSEAPTISVAFGSQFLKVKRRQLLEQPAHLAGVKRSTIHTASSKSRGRLRDLCLHIDRQAEGYEICCTYPAQFPVDWHEYKRHWKIFGQRLQYKFSGVSLIWRLEFQQRQAAHFHGLLYGLPANRLQEFRAWISKTWYEVVGSGDQKHLRSGTEVSKIRDSAGMIGSMAKYLSKDEQATASEVGRWWGVWGRERLPMRPEAQITITDTDFYKAARIARRLVKPQLKSKSEKDRAKYGRAVSKWRKWQGRKLQAVTVACDATTVFLQLTEFVSTSGEWVNPATGEINGREQGR